LHNKILWSWNYKCSTFEKKLEAVAIKFMPMINQSINQSINLFADKQLKQLTNI